MDASPSTPPPPTPQRRPMFGAFVDPPKRRYWPWIVGITAAFAVALLIASIRDPSEFNLITPHGIKTVRLEMTQTQVRSVLGKPIAQISSDGCYHYGWPKMEMEFDVYRVCFAEGRVREVKTERFEVRRVLGQDQELELPEEPAPASDLNVWGPPPAQPEGAAPTTP